MKVKKSTGIALALAAASAFAAAPMTVIAGEEAPVQCHGVNQCKGQNDCKTASNACKGQGSCKGQGFLNMTKQACEDAGGKVGA
jgi:hypothetical protein